MSIIPTTDVETGSVGGTVSIETGSIVDSLAAGDEAGSIVDSTGFGINGRVCLSYIGCGEGAIAGIAIAGIAIAGGKPLFSPVTESGSIGATP